MTRILPRRWCTCRYVSIRADTFTFFFSSNFTLKAKFEEKNRDHAPLSHTRINNSSYVCVLTVKVKFYAPPQEDPEAAAK